MAVVAPTVFARVIVLALKGGRCENTARPLGPPVSELNADALRDGQDIAGWMVGIWYERTMEKKLNYSVTSKPMTADTDSDSMTDFEEFMNGSDPGKLDRDGDTITAPWKLLARLLPLQKPRYPPLPPPSQVFARHERF
jgi:hypothetical protein